jgi:hypothetical protein
LLVVPYVEDYCYGMQAILIQSFWREHIHMFPFRVVLAAPLLAAYFRA